MDPTSLQDVQFGLHTEVWTRRLFFPAILTHSAQNFRSEGTRHFARTHSFEFCAWEGPTLCYREIQIKHLYKRHGTGPSCLGRHTTGQEQEVLGSSCLGRWSRHLYMLHLF